MDRYRVFMVVSVMLLVDTAAASDAYFKALGRLKNGKSSDARAISGDGSTVVGLADARNGYNAMRWTLSEGMSSMGKLAGTSSPTVALGVSYDGSVVTGTGSNKKSKEEGFRWTASDGLVALGGFPEDPEFSRASGISNDGNVIVGQGYSDHQQGFTWTTADGFAGLEDKSPLNGFSWAYAASADASRVVGRARDDQFRAVASYWDSERTVHLLGDVPGRAVDITPNGEVIVGWQIFNDSEERAFRWTEDGGLVDLQRPSEWTGSFVTGVSGDGSVIVGGGVRHFGESDIPFIWDEATGCRDLREFLKKDVGLDLGGFAIWNVNGISDDGLMLCGTGYSAGEHQEGWIARIPEPSTALLAAHLFAFVGLKARRCRAAI